MANHSHKSNPACYLLLQIKFYWNKITSIHVHTVYGYFDIRTTKLNSSDRDCMLPSFRVPRPNSSGEGVVSPYTRPTCHYLPKETIRFHRLRVKGSILQDFSPSLTSDTSHKPQAVTCASDQLATDWRFQQLPH